jgi:hypothetical protein
MNAANLLAAWGQALGLPELALSDLGTAALLIDGTLTLNIEHEDDAGRLLLYVPLGAPPAAEREACFARLLQANLFGHGSGGGHIGLDAQRDELVLSRQLALDNTDLPALEAAIESLLAAARQLRELLAQSPSGATPTTGPVDTGPTSAQAYMLRA